MGIKSFLSTKTNAGLEPERVCLGQHSQVTLKMLDNSYCFLGKLSKGTKKIKQFPFTYSGSAISSTLSPRGQFAIYHEIINFISPAEIAFCYSTTIKKYYS